MLLVPHLALHLVPHLASLLVFEGRPHLLKSLAPRLAHGPPAQHLVQLAHQMSRLAVKQVMMQRIPLVQQQPALQSPQTPQAWATMARSVATAVHPVPPPLPHPVPLPAPQPAPLLASFLPLPRSLMAKGP